MKQLLTVLTVIIILSSCRGCYADYAERKKGVQQVCPTCNYVRSENMDFAVDTAKQPNIIYRVVFRQGGVYYKASDVDHLIRVN